MKRFAFFCLIYLTVSALGINGQELLKHDSIGDFVEWKHKKRQSKALGDTLYYEDFDSTGRSANNFLPPGWTVTDSTNQGHMWIWSDQPPGGQYSSTMSALNSPTTSNGYLSLPADAYNSPSPSGPFVQMNATVSSAPIAISPRSSVIVEFRQNYRYCCQQNRSNLTLEVSIDGVNWVEYFNNTVLSQSTTRANGYLVSVDVSPTLANQSTVYVRFNFSNASHYYWQIDDLTLLEGPVNAFQINEHRITTSDSFYWNPTYTQYPFPILDSISATAIFENTTANDLTNFKVDWRVFQDSALDGSQGKGFIFQDSVLLAQPMSAFTIDTIKLEQNKFKPNTTGYYRSQILLSSDSVNETPQLGVIDLEFVISDSVLARDFGVFAGSAGPDNYLGGGNDGDRWGVLFSVGAQGELINSLSIYVANDSDVVGSTIVAKIWGFEQDSATLTAALSNAVLSGSPITITSAMLGSWIHLPFNNIHGNRFLNAGKQYVMGWEQIAGAANGSVFLAGRDRLSEPSVPIVTNFVFINDASPSWGWVTQVAGIRANFRPALVGLESAASEESSFELYPNPNQGLFTLKLGEVSAYQLLALRDLKGQLIRQAKLNGNQIHHFDFSDLKSGIYLISLLGESNRETQKLIVY